MIFTILIFLNLFPSQDDYNTLNIEITELNNSDVIKLSDLNI